MRRISLKQYTRAHTRQSRGVSNARNQPSAIQSSHARFLPPVGILEETSDKLAVAAKGQVSRVPSANNVRQQSQCNSIPPHVGLNATQALTSDKNARTDFYTATHFCLVMVADVTNRAISNSSSRYASKLHEWHGLRAH